MKQLCIYNRETKKHFFALGFQNEEEGFEVRNPFFKGCLGTKAITFIRGTAPKPSGIHLFEGMMDYLSVLECKGIPQLSEDAIILNSLSIVQTATPYIKNYGYAIAYTWLDNDPAGDKAGKALAAFFESEVDLRHKPMNPVYQPHKDVNAWHMHKLRL